MRSRLGLKPTEQDKTQHPEGSRVPEKTEILGQRRKSPYVVTEERTEGFPIQVPEPSSAGAGKGNKTREGAGEEVKSAEDETVV